MSLVSARNTHIKFIQSHRRHLNKFVYIRKRPVDCMTTKSRPSEDRTKFRPKKGVPQCCAVSWWLTESWSYKWTIRKRMLGYRGDGVEGVTCGQKLSEETGVCWMKSQISRTTRVYASVSFCREHFERPVWNVGRPIRVAGWAGQCPLDRRTRIWWVWRCRDKTDKPKVNYPI